MNTPAVWVEYTHGRKAFRLTYRLRGERDARTLDVEAHNHADALNALRNQWDSVARVMITAERKSKA